MPSARPGRWSAGSRRAALARARLGRRPGGGRPYGPYFQSERLALSRGGRPARRRQPRVFMLLLHRAAAGRASGGRSAWRRLAIRSAVSLARRERYRAPAGQGRAARGACAGPAGRTTFDDLVHGPITIEHSTIEDFVILRSDGQPTYQLSVVCDDIDMAITDVVRGDDHISNTPKQILLFARSARRFRASRMCR